MISNVLQLPGGSATKGAATQVPIQGDPVGSGEGFGGKLGSFAGLLSRLGDAIDPAGKDVSEPAEGGKILPDGLPDTLPETLPETLLETLPETVQDAKHDKAPVLGPDLGTDLGPKTATLPVLATEGAIAATPDVQSGHGVPVDEASVTVAVGAIAPLPGRDPATASVPAKVAERPAKAPAQPGTAPLPQTQQILTGEQAVLAASKGVLTVEPGKADPKLPEAVTASIGKAAAPLASSSKDQSPAAVQTQALPTVSVSVPAAPDAQIAGVQPSALLAPTLSGNGALAGADQPRDFEALIDRLVQAREAAGSTSGGAVRMSIPHAEFGAVNMRFDPSGAAMSVALSSSDAAFIPAVRAALEAGISREDNPQSRGEQSSAGPQPNQAHSQSGTNSGGQSQAHQRFNAENRDQARQPAEHGPADPSELAGDHRQTAVTSAEAMRRGFYI